MTHREITADTEWASRDEARAARLRAERVEQDPVAQAELHAIQWEEVPTPYMAAIDTQPDMARVSLYRAMAERASCALVSGPAVKDFIFSKPNEGRES